MRTIDWDAGAVVIIDQTLLPRHTEFVRLETVDDLVAAIKRLSVRGAPALGAAGGLGVALAAVNAQQAGLEGEALTKAVRQDASRVATARPTAANLRWGVERVLARLGEGVEAVIAEAQAIVVEDGRVNRAIGKRGADFLTRAFPDGVRLLTHCNAGSLACVEWGTALGVARTLLDRGALRHVIATETRPLLQGARLTCWELTQLGASHQLVVDGAGPAVIARRLVDAVVVGADRIAANGDVVNKIGTYGLALAASRSGVPFLVAAPESTIDAKTPSGADVEIEERDSDEVAARDGIQTTPESTPALNLAFDVTPRELVTAIITEERTI